MSARQRFIGSASLVAAVLVALAAVPGTSGGADHRFGASRSVASGMIPQLSVGSIVSTVASQPPTSAQCAANTGGVIQVCYGPPDIRNQYDFNRLYTGGITGAGQTIVIFDAFGSPTIAQDLASFDSAYGIPGPPSFKVYEPEGHVTLNYNKLPSPVGLKNKNVVNEIGWAYETTLDVEWAHAMAPGANIALVVTPVADVQGQQNFTNLQSWALANHIGTIWSTSGGSTEQSLHASALIQRLDALYAQAASQGITAFFSSGDFGVANYNTQFTTVYPYPTVVYPSSSPNVVSVGGTEIAAPPPTISSYQPEAVWNDFGGAGGGGFSTVFAEPGYQSSTAISDPSGMRGSPDVSFNAALVSPILIYESFDPTGPPGWLYIGGTSAAAPQWAALDALANQADGPLGFLTPRLYQIYTNGSYASAFHDITTGNNSWAGITGFNAATGWDPATGLGTPDAYQLVQALKNTTPTP